MHNENIAGQNINMGVETTFTHIYRLYFGSFCFFSLKYLNDKVEAEDVVGEIFTKLFQQSIEFNDEGHLKGYLYRAVRNASLNYLRGRTNAKERQFQFAEGTEKLENTDHNNIISTEIYGEIYRAITELPPQCSKVIQLCYLEGLKNEEVANKLGLSMQTIKNYKIRGIKILKDKLSPELYQLLLLLPNIELLDLLTKK